jgi:hypothetical protein
MVAAAPLIINSFLAVGDIAYGSRRIRNAPRAFIAASPISRDPLIDQCLVC